MAQGTHKLIGQILIERGLITEPQLEESLQAQKDTTQRIGQVLVGLGYLDEHALYDALSEQLGVRYINLAQFAIDRDVAMLVPRDIAERYEALPIARGDGCIRVAMAEPGNVLAMDDLRVRLQMQVEPVLSSSEAITKAIAKVHEGSGAGGAGGGETATRSAGMGGMGDLESLAKDVLAQGSLGATDAASSDERGDDRVEELVDEAPIIKIARVIIQKAIQERASDIHIEPERRGVRIRYRIDGVCHEVMKVPKYVHAPLISRVKIMSEMNIAERRVPQDGRIHIRYDGKDFDLRVSIIPTTMGEKSVMRILDKSSILIGLEKLGLMPQTQAVLETLIVQPNGMLLSTGPTGSGKTTTQYSILNKINSVEKNIITIEDPVEYQLGGIAQVHVNRKAGLTFAIALKYFLRQDPDIIMVGEIRDLETSEIAIQAALTGHLVLSTLHTNDAPSTVTRLVDMGVEPFLISASVIGSLAQRLARKICDECREPYTPPRDKLLGFGFDPDLPENRDVVFYKGAGCDECRHTGYRGRIGLFELLVMNGEIAELVVKRATHNDIKEAALAAGMITLQQDGFQKVLMGVTDVEELTRVVFTAGQML